MDHISESASLDTLRDTTKVGEVLEGSVDGGLASDNGSMVDDTVQQSAAPMTAREQREREEPGRSIHF